jgi:2-haloacid dehalogenase
LQQFDIRGLKEAEKDHLNRAWHRLVPWPDSVRGLKRLKKQFVISTLSNGNLSLLTNMAKNAGLPWDCVLSAELFHHYKPDPESYLGAAKMLGFKLVAAHKDDLRAARRCGLRTAFVRRPKEKGPHVKPDLASDRAFDYNSDDFLDLAGQLGV